MTPFEPIGAEPALSFNASRSNPSSDRMVSVATVTFMVQASGSQWPSLEQNAASSPCASTTGLVENA